MNDVIISEIALRCDDINFKDFPKNIYQLAYRNALKEVSRKYRISKRLHKSFYYNSNGEIKLNLPDFVKDFKLKVNGKEYTAENEIKNDYEYNITAINNELILKYKPYTEKDEIELYYVADLDEASDSEPIVPGSYLEEVINHAVYEIAKIGFAKFVGNELLRNKYESLLRLYIKQIGLKSDLIKDEEWIAVKPFRLY